MTKIYDLKLIDLFNFQQNKKPNAKPKSDVDIEYLIIVSHNVIAFRAVGAEAHGGAGGNLPV